MKLHAAIIYDSRYGTTAKVAAALARGFDRVPNVSAEVAYASKVHADVFERSHLIIIGGPTEFFSASRHLRTFFDHIGGYDLHAKFGFAFDTRAARPLRGSAAPYIERHLKAMGVKVLKPRESALVLDGAAPGSSRPIHLAEGTVEHFEALGEKLGQELLERMAKFQAHSGGTAHVPDWSV